jgi:hypothetical protein
MKTVRTGLQRPSGFCCSKVTFRTALERPSSQSFKLFSEQRQDDAPGILFELHHLGIEVAMMKDTDTLEFTFIIQIVEYILI